MSSVPPKNLGSHSEEDARALNGFPHLKHYLEVLPNGLDSYPECKTKGAVVRSSLDDVAWSPLFRQLPSVLQDLLREPPSMGFWVPAVHTDAIFHALCDVYYPDEARMLAWTRERTSTIRGSLYGAILRVSGPRRFFSFAARTQRIFQRGTETTNELLEDERLITRLTFPDHLHTEFNLLANVAVLETMARATGAKSPEASMLEWGKDYARFECRWR